MSTPIGGDFANPTFILKINVALAKSPPIGVDTEEDYMALKKIMEYKD